MVRNGDDDVSLSIREINVLSSVVLKLNIINNVGISLSLKTKKKERRRKHRRKHGKRLSS